MITISFRICFTARVINNYNYYIIEAEPFITIIVYKNCLFFFCIFKLMSLTILFVLCPLVFLILCIYFRSLINWEGERIDLIGNSLLMLWYIMQYNKEVCTNLSRGKFLKGPQTKKIVNYTYVHTYVPKIIFFTWVWDNNYALVSPAYPFVWRIKQPACNRETNSV